VVGWVAGREALVGLLAVGDSRSGLTEITGIISSKLASGHGARGTWRKHVRLYCVSECGMFRGWSREAAGRRVRSKEARHRSVFHL